MEKPIGALWKKEEIDGQKHQVVVFKNTMKKEGESTPDYRIFASKPRQDEPEF